MHGAERALDDVENADRRLILELPGSPDFQGLVQAFRQQILRAVASFFPMFPSKVSVPVELLLNVRLAPPAQVMVVPAPKEPFNTRL